MSTYGLIAKTANNTFTIDGSSSNYSGLQAQAEVSGSPSSIAAGELFLDVKPQVLALLLHRAPL